MGQPTEPSVAASLGTQRRPRNRSERQIAESAELKAAIVRAAATAFAERGYAQTTLDAVARLVGLTRPGILHHFASKEALFRAVLEQERVWAEHRAQAAVSDGPLGPVRELGAFLGGGDDARIPLQLIHVLEGEALAGNEAAADYVRSRTALVRGEILTRLRICQSRGDLPRDADLERLVTLVAATINGLQKAWLLQPQLDTHAAFRRFVDALPELAH
ncbi:TetR family transcriptional regulator [Dactylosporangium sp. NPDC051541]|uniref:TetR family transcriptional regulator n=1 Tax=Dactylosporangium sp. NPDC051541 TaxID=3363977 RepID=UPI003792E736